MKKIIAGTSGGFLLAIMLPGIASAHVTVKPNEVVAEGFQTFFVQVPNERDNASTTKVEIEFPHAFASVSFQPKPGWKRTVKMVKFDEPIEAFGDQVTEGVGTVTWSGGEIAPGEFETFYFSAGVVPEGELVFPALQTYSSGQVVRWIGPPDSDEPSPVVRAIDLGLAEGQGELSAIAAVSDQAGPADDAADDEADDDGAPVLEYLALATAVLALIVSLTRFGSRRA